MGLKPTIYHTRGEHASHYFTDAIAPFSDHLYKAITSITWP